VRLRLDGRPPVAPAALSACDRSNNAPARAPARFDQNSLLDAAPTPRLLLSPAATAPGWTAAAVTATARWLEGLEGDAEAADTGRSSLRAGSAALVVSPTRKVHPVLLG
jgi:hypothetical protein